MFHVRKAPHQTRIASFFKPMIKPMRKIQRNTLPQIKTQAPSPTSPGSPNRKTATFQSRKSTNWSSKRYLSDLPLKIAWRRILKTPYISHGLHKRRQLLQASIIIVYTSKPRHLAVAVLRYYDADVQSFPIAAFFKKNDIQTISVLRWQWLWSDLKITILSSVADFLCNVIMIINTWC